MPHLLGRAQLTQQVTDALVPGASNGSVVAVSGPAGIGKTTLLIKCCDQLAARGARVVTSAAYDSGTHQPFAAVRPLLRSEGMPTAGSVFVSGDPVTAALTRVDEWCGLGPVVIWVDDAQHLDAGSATVLARLARATSSLPLTVLLSARSWTSGRELTMLAELATASVEVPPLRQEEIHELIVDRTRRAPGPRLMEGLAVAAGNPLALTILMDVLRERRAVVAEGDVVELRQGDRTLPEASTVAARAQLQTLPAQTRDLATAMAVLGAPTDPRDLAALVARPTEGPLEELGPAIRAGIVMWDDDRLVFGHDAYQDALLADLPPSSRQAIHRQAVQILRLRGASDEDVAEHVIRGGDRQFAGLVLGVAESLTGTAPGVAADLLAQVQPFTSAQETDRVVLRRAQALFLSGRPVECDDLIRTHLPRVRSREVAMSIQLLSLTALNTRANIGALVGQIDNLLQNPALPVETRNRLLTQRVNALVLGGHLRAAESALDEYHKEQGSEIDDLLTVPAALVALMHGRAADAEQMVTAALERSPDEPWLRNGAARPGGHRVPGYARSPDEARQVAAEARTIAASYEARWSLPLHDGVLGQICMDGGWWDDAIANLDAALELALETGSGWMVVTNATRALIDLHRGDTDLARRRLDLPRLRGQPSVTGLDLPGQARLLLLEDVAVQHEAAGRDVDAAAERREAANRAAQLWSQACELGSELWQARIAVDILRIADPDVRDDVARAATTWPTGQMPCWDHVGPLVLGLYGQDFERARTAAAAITESRIPLMAASAWEEVGVLAAELGQRTTARQALRTALDGYDDLGAVTDAVRLRSRANQFDIRPNRPTPQNRPATGWDALTPTERTIAQHVQEGMTNPQIATLMFLSPRTVQTHVSHIIRKTGLNTRVEIAAALAQRTG